MKKTLWAVIALAAWGLPYGLSAQESIIRPAHLITIGDGASGVTRQFFGQVVARQTVDLAFQVGGQITDFPAAEGEPIEEGALIAQLDLEPFELNFEQAQLQFDQAERALDRLNRLTSSVSEVARQDAETALGLARVALRDATVSLENATLHAPFDGLVAARNIANFSTVGAGSPVVRLHDMSELRVEIDVPEVLFQQAGEDPNVTLLARFPARDTTYPLEVREFNAEASSVGQTFRLTLALTEQDRPTVLPGSSVTVLATISTDNPVITVPATAIQITNDDKTQVLRFEADGDDTGVLVATPIEIDASRNGDVVVVSGLEAGDVIVRNGVQALEDGQRVRRFSGFPN
ncbi:MAG: efflux RND transporter periplasmic adaptor subunit [Pseudomonadota bacterium]